MKVERIPVDAIEVGKGRRPVDGKIVAALAASMRMIGQLQPITVYEESGTAHLIAGRHRLEAAEFLGWDDIEAVFVTGDEIDHRLREISENLHRAELTVQERSDQIAEWAELIEQKRAVQSAQLGQNESKRSDGRGHRRPSGESQAARDLNLTRQNVQRAKDIAGIAPEAKAAAHEARLDNNQSALLAIAKEPTPERQVAKVIEFKERGKVDDRTWRDHYMALWAKGTPDDHAWAKEYIDKPIMDSRYGA